MRFNHTEAEITYNIKLLEINFLVCRYRVPWSSVI